MHEAAKSHAHTQPMSAWGLVYNIRSGERWTLGYNFQSFTVTGLDVIKDAIQEYILSSSSYYLGK